ncbi:ATP-binding protein [Terasakiella sp. SH-1]|uniref:ATP-binding protein n=1 Tax=Terasakiella sp. SH-1 TaxID=2560057 RepID=UPI001431ACE0|nr:ATP-binding protein [Terasakiella sp. SH-1]
MLFRKKKPVIDRKTPQEGDASKIDETNAILASLADPILVLDSERVVKYANQAAMDLFGRVLVGRNIVQCIRQPHVVDAVEQVFQTQETWVGDASFPAPVERHLTLHVALIAEGEGVSITVRDTTLEKRTEEMHSDFVANVSHELRSPLSALVGFIETLQGAAQNDPDARERFLGIMIQEANRMARLIDDLLSLSRVQIQEHVVPDDSVDVGLVLQNVTDILALKANDRQMELILNYEAKDCMVAGDSDQMTQVFQNLLDNAIKYGKPATPVEITTRYVDRLPHQNVPGVLVEIRDHGDGIDEEHLPRLTERFYRVDKARSRTLGGTGLGLAIVKHIIARHRGRLNIESKTGEGSTFSVLLPIKL